MLTWVVYDISKDKTRTKVAKRCLDFGLYRVQKSVFLGDLPNNRIEEILLFSRAPSDLHRCIRSCDTRASYYSIKGAAIARIIMRTAD